MLSKVRDIDVFRVGKETRRWSDIELYPKVYTSPHLIYLNKQITNRCVVGAVQAVRALVGRRCVGKAGMINLQKELAEVEQDLANSKKVLRTAKRKKKAKGTSDEKRERDNAKRVLKTIKQGVEMERRRDNVEKQLGRNARSRAK